MDEYHSERIHMSKEPQDPPEDDLFREGDDYEDARRGLMDSLVPKMVKRVLAQGMEALGDEKISETVVADVVRKAILKGNEVVDVTEDSVRRLVGELPVAKEVADRVTSKLDDYRADLVRVITDEMRGFFDRVDLGSEIQKALTSLSLEISTEIRFVPVEPTEDNDKTVEPKIKSKTRVKRSNTSKKRAPTKTK